MLSTNITHHLCTGSHAVQGGIETLVGLHQWAAPAYQWRDADRAASACLSSINGLHDLVGMQIAVCGLSIERLQCKFAAC